MMPHVDFHSCLRLAGQVESKILELVELRTAGQDVLRQARPSATEPKSMQRLLYQLGSPIGALRVRIEVGLERRGSLTAKHRRAPHRERPFHLLGQEKVLNVAKTGEIGAKRPFQASIELEP